MFRSHMNMAMKLLLAAVILCAFIKGCESSYCLKYTSSWYGGTYSTYVYCAYGCCGTAYSRSCCSYSYYGTYTYSSFTWSIGAIVGAVIGGVIGLVVIILIIVCVIKAVNKSGSHGRVVHPVSYGHQPNVFVSGTSSTVHTYPPTHSVMPPPNQPMPPPAYSGPSVAHPPPAPAYLSPPGQPPISTIGPTKT